MKTEQCEVKIYKYRAVFAASNIESIVKMPDAQINIIGIKCSFGYDDDADRDEALDHAAEQLIRGCAFVGILKR